MRYFITNVLPHHLCGKYNVSTAAANFSWALINSDAFDCTYSVAPSNVIGEIRDVEMPQLVYSSFRTRGRFFSRIAPFVENFQIFKRIKQKSSVWFYNISIINILLFYMLKLFKPSVKCNVIILDIYIPKRKLSLDNFFLYTINKADATIRLSNSKRFLCKNSVCLPGVVPSNSPKYPFIKEPRPTFLLSGLLREDISQIGLVIDAFSEIGDAELYISGFSDDDQRIKEKCADIPNIHYLGEIPYDNYLELLHSVTFLLSMRDPREEGNQCNFPSKVIEGILHNKIIVSTIEYEQLMGLKYFKVSSNKSELKEQIMNILAKDNLIEYANQSKYAFDAFNPDKWADIMNILETKD